MIVLSQYRATINTQVILTLEADPATEWTPGDPGLPTFTISGIDDATIVSQEITDVTKATLTIFTGTMPGSLTISDGDNTALLTVKSVLYKRWYPGLSQRRR